jgi:hypothetical protein
MKFNYKMLLLTAGLLSGTSAAQADLLATFATVPVSGCPTCTAIDPTGLEANAVGHELFGGSHPWDVWANASERLTVANGIGVDFTVPGKTFDLKKLKLFGLSSKYSTTAPLTYNVVAYHPNNPVPDVIPFTIAARVVRSVDLTGYTQLNNLEKVSISYPATSYIGKTNFIEVQFIPH